MNFTTFEQVQESYPLGYIYNTERLTQRMYCAHDIILDKMKQYYGEENVKMISPHHAECAHYIFHTVDGYIYDGEYWHPAESYLGGWRILI